MCVRKPAFQFVELTARQSWDSAQRSWFDQILPGHKSLLKSSVNEWHQSAPNLVAWVVQLVPYWGRLWVCCFPTVHNIAAFCTPKAQYTPFIPLPAGIPQWPEQHTRTAYISPDSQTQTALPVVYAKGRRGRPKGENEGRKDGRHVHHIPRMEMVDDVFYFQLSFGRRIPTNRWGNWYF